MAIILPLISLSSGCLLFTDPINEAPRILSVDQQMTDSGVNQTTGPEVVFSAHVEDDTPTTLRYAWALNTGKCPLDGTVPKGMPAHSDTRSSFEFPLPIRGDYCVSLTITDQDNASDHKTTPFTLADQPPKAHLTLISTTTTALTAPGDTGVPLYSALRFSAAGPQPSSDPDNDPLNFTFVLHTPDGQTSTPPPCAGSTTDVCFSVDTPGPYELVLNAGDPDRMVSQDMSSFVVAEDQAPCIVETDPPYAIEGLVRDSAHLTFAVTEVADDGDPLPAPQDRISRSSFAWSWRADGAGAFTRMIVPDVPSFSLPPGVFESGQTVEVQAEAHDRLHSTCDDTGTDPSVCMPRAGCNQRVTWTVEVL
jgi:hypothetical protein